MKPLRPSEMPAKTANHFIEDEDRAVPPAKTLDVPQKVVGRRCFLFRFHDEAGDLPRILLKQGLYALQRVVTEFDGQLLNAFRDTCRHGRRPYEPIVP